MRFSVPTLSHTFLRMGLFVVLAIILLTPVTPVFATHTGNPIDHATTYTPDIPIGPNGYPSFDLYAGTGIDTIAGTNGGQVYDIDSDGVADPGEPAYTPPAPTTDNAKEIIGYSNKLSDEKAYGIMIGLGGWIAGLGGNAFEIAFGNFVLKLGCYFTKPGCSLEGGMGGGAGQVGQIVNELWSVIRDLFNLALIFSLVYIGFRMILDAEDSSMKKALGNIIIAALLVNFSLYIAKLVVDIANFSAVQIYSHMIKPSGAQQLVIDGGVGDFSVGAGNLVAASFMEVLLIPSWFSNGDIANSWTFAIAALIFLVFLGFIFLYAAFMMLARFIAIVVMLIFSPLMFLGLVLPQFKGYSDTWRKLFVGYAFFAPVYVFFLYLTLYTLIQLRPGGVSNDKGYAGAFVDGGTFSQDMMGIFVFFFVGIGMLYASTKIAAKMASDGAVGIMNFGDKWGKKLSLGLAGAGGALAYRNTAGWAANKGLQGMDRVDRTLAGAQSKVGKMSKWNPAKYAAGAVLYGGREIAGGTTTRGAVEGAANYGAFGGRGRKKAKEDMDAQNKRVAEQKAKGELKAAVSGGVDSAPGSTERIKLERGIADASGAQIEALGAGTLSKKTVAGALTSSQFESLMKSDKFTDTEKGAMATARKEATIERLTDTVASRVKVETASVSQLEALGTEYMEQNAGLLTPSQLDDLKKKLTESEFGRIKDANKEALLTQVRSQTPQAAFQQPDGTPKKDKDIAQLPGAVLKHANAVPYLNANILKNILDKETLNATERAALKIAVQAHSGYTQAQQQAFLAFFNSAIGATF